MWLRAVMDLWPWSGHPCQRLGIGCRGATHSCHGNSSVALGAGTTASGPVSVALGSYTTASGLFSIAMVMKRLPATKLPVALGYKTIASEVSSFASGSYSTSHQLVCLRTGIWLHGWRHYSLSWRYQQQASGAGAFIGGAVMMGVPIMGNTASGPDSAIGGGTQNITGGSRSTVAGATTTPPPTLCHGRWRRVESAGGVGSFAAGQAAKAVHDGAFVWSDSFSS